MGIGKGREERETSSPSYLPCKRRQNIFFFFEAKDVKGGESEHSDLLSVYSIVCITSV